MQLFVNVNSHTISLEAEGTGSLVRDVKERIEALEGLPISEQRLQYAGKILEDGRTLEHYGVKAESTLQVFLPLCGGKGGFGNLLRHIHATEKVTNFDACRDLHGRRVRYVEAEKKMKEWEETKRERELEKVAMEHAKKLEKEERLRKAEDVNKDEVVDLQRRAIQQVSSAIHSGIKQHEVLQETLKRKKEEQLEKQAQAAKRMRLYGLDDDLSDLSDEDDGAKKKPAKKAQQPPAKASQPPAAQAVARKPDADLPKKTQTAPAAAAAAAAPREPASAPSTSAPAVPAVAAAAAPAVQAEKPKKREKQPAAPVSFEDDGSEPLDVSMFDSEEELELLGLDVLKRELMRHGLKAGGTLKERAARLFLLKDTPLDKIDAKHKAKK